MLVDLKISVETMDSEIVLSEDGQLYQLSSSLESELESGDHLEVVQLFKPDYGRQSETPLNLVQRQDKIRSFGVTGSGLVYSNEKGEVWLTREMTQKEFDSKIRQDNKDQEELMKEIFSESNSEVLGWRNEDFEEYDLDSDPIPKAK